MSNRSEKCHNCGFIHSINNICAMGGGGGRSNVPNTDDDEASSCPPQPGPGGDSNGGPSQPHGGCDGNSGQADDNGNGRSGQTNGSGNGCSGQTGSSANGTSGQTDDGNGGSGQQGGGKTDQPCGNGGGGASGGGGAPPGKPSGGGGAPPGQPSGNSGGGGAPPGQPSGNSGGGGAPPGQPSGNSGGGGAPPGQPSGNSGGGGAPPGQPGGCSGNGNALGKFVAQNCPAEILCFFIVLIGCVCIMSTLNCSGSSSISNCLGMDSCDINENMRSTLRKAGVVESDCTIESSSRIPPHLLPQLEAFRAASKNKKCWAQEACSGQLTNYAGATAGAYVASIGRTKSVANPALCRCMDKETQGVCIPKIGPCVNCKCDSVDAEIVLQENELLTVGRCWAFVPPGELHIKMFYSVIVIGVTVHHIPAKKVLPGALSSTPKDFELYGLSKEYGAKGKTKSDPNVDGTKAKATHEKSLEPVAEIRSPPNSVLLAKFQFKNGSDSTQIFPIQKINPTKFSDVKFHILSNHGHPNYTSLYRIEVHGLLDHGDSG